MTPARDIGKYSGYGEEAWNDELLVGDQTSDLEEQIQALVSDAEDKEGRAVGGRVKENEVVEKPIGRVSEAHEKGDKRSLNRWLMRTMYLVVKRAERGTNDGEWMFPGCVLEGKESLHTVSRWFAWSMTGLGVLMRCAQAAERIIVQTGGVNMNTWVVGNIPVIHQVFKYPGSQRSQDEANAIQGEKTFYMKARMMAGQANLKDNKFGLNDFQWLVKEELQKALQPRDFAAVKNVLANR